MRHPSGSGVFSGMANDWLLTIAVVLQGVGIPLPEHPRPDFQRDLWQNLNPELPGALAIYRRRFGRYPLDPTVIFLLRR